MWFWVCLYIFLSSIVLSAALTKLMTRVAHRYRIYDEPGHRKIQHRPIPYLGGVAIYLALVLVILLNLLLVYLLRDRVLWATWLYPSLFTNQASYRQAVGLVLGSSFIFGLGLVDDIKHLTAAAKLVGQIIAALILVAFEIRLYMFISSSTVGAAITVFWVVLVTNAFNLLDNMDGLSAGVAAIASLLFFAVVFPQGQVYVGVVLLAFAGSLLGFLRYNFSPAKIFMGDAGAMFIGFVLSTLTIVSTFYTEASPTVWPIVMPLLILSVPLFDTARVIFIRWRVGAPVFVGDDRHLSHELVRLGMSRKWAVVFIYLVAFAVGLAATLLRHLSFQGVLVVLAQTLGIFAIIVLLMNAAKR